MRKVIFFLLSIIGIIIALILLYIFVIVSNEYSRKTYNYEIFNVENFIVSFLAYLALYFGNEWYLNALKAGKDILNGQLLMGIGVILLSIIIYLNVKKTSLSYGLIMGFVAEILYLAATPLVFFAFIMMMAYFGQAKPVYNIND